MPTSRKDEMINMVKERFDVPPGIDDWMLKSISKKCRSWKSRIKTKYFDPNVSFERRIHNRPTRVLENQWKGILSHWDSEEAKTLYETNKEHRQKKMMNTTGKLSFVEVYEEQKEKLGRFPFGVELFDACHTDSNGNLANKSVGTTLAEIKKHQSKLLPGSLDVVSPEDSFAKVRGKDPPGHVVMHGLGVNQSDVWGKLPSRASLSRHQSSSSVNAYSLKIGGSVVLKSMFDLIKIVAKGILQNTDSTTSIRGQQLGANWYEVHVFVLMDWDEELIRPYSRLKTIGDALGTSIAWPRNMVMSSEN